jgi:hypothetical protein
MKTNRLSIDRLCSSRYPAKYSAVLGGGGGGGPRQHARGHPQGRHARRGRRLSSGRHAALQLACALVRTQSPPDAGAKQHSCSDVCCPPLCALLQCRLIHLRHAREAWGNWTAVPNLWASVAAAASLAQLRRRCGVARAAPPPLWRRPPGAPGHTSMFCMAFSSPASSVGDTGASS